MLNEALKKSSKLPKVNTTKVNTRRKFGSLQRLTDVDYAKCQTVIKNILLTFSLNEEELFEFF